jgi:hypothetical protein
MSQKPAAAKGPANSHETLPYHAKSETKARNARKKMTRLLKKLQEKKLVGEDYSLTRLKGYLAIIGLDADAPVGVIERAIEEKQRLEKINGSANGKYPDKNDSEKEKDSVPDQIAQGPSQTKTDPPKAKEENIRITKAHRKAFKKAVQSGKAQPGTIRQWLQLQDNPEPEHEPIQPIQPKQTTDPDAWRSKIWLNAVECEKDGATLPAPDFPFHQQQLHGMNPGKKRKRNNKRKQTQEQQYDGQYHEHDVGILDYGDELADKNQAATSGPDEYDLPKLPSDLSSLSPLTGPVLPGTIVAFRRFAINYKTMTPEYMEYCTARVEKVHDIPDGPLLELRLAIRDRVQPEIDPETGEKIIGKFDMPGYEKEEESGYLEMMFGELLEAKILQAGKEPEMHQEQGPKCDGDGGHNEPGELDWRADIWFSEADFEQSCDDEAGPEKEPTKEPTLIPEELNDKEPTPKPVDTGPSSAPPDIPHGWYLSPPPPLDRKRPLTPSGLRDGTPTACATSSCSPQRGRYNGRSPRKQHPPHRATPNRRSSTRKPHSPQF